MVIDIHTHTFPDKLAAPTIRKLQGACHTRAFTDATNAGLRSTPGAAGPASTPSAASTRTVRTPGESWLGSPPWV